MPLNITDTELAKKGLPWAAVNFISGSWAGTIVSASYNPETKVEYQELLGQEQAEKLALEVVKDAEKLGRLPRGYEQTGHYTDNQCHFLYLLSTYGWEPL
jgi:hypothetical protein